MSPWFLLQGRTRGLTCAMGFVPHLFTGTQPDPVSTFLLPQHLLLLCSGSAQPGSFSQKQILATRNRGAQLSAPWATCPCCLHAVVNWTVATDILSPWCYYNRCIIIFLFCWPTEVWRPRTFPPRLLSLFSKLCTSVTTHKGSRV